MLTRSGSSKAYRGCDKQVTLVDCPNVKVAIVVAMKSPAMLDLDPEAVPCSCLLEVEVVTAFTAGGPEITADEAPKVTLGFDFGSSSPGGAVVTALTAVEGN